ncbi:unnamed protein product [Fusarium fujikuroi]|nr:unnamed protein product [Fusarium fujikuroi]
MSNYFILGEGRYQLLLSLGKAYLLDTLAVAHRHTLYAIDRTLRLLIHNSTGARSANILGHMFAGVADNVPLALRPVQFLCRKTLGDETSKSATGLAA